MDVSTTANMVTIHVQTMWLIAALVIVVLLVFLKKR